MAKNSATALVVAKASESKMELALVLRRSDSRCWWAHGVLRIAGGQELKVTEIILSVQRASR